MVLRKWLKKTKCHLDLNITVLGNKSNSLLMNLHFLFPTKPIQTVRLVCWFFKLMYLFLKFVRQCFRFVFLLLIISSLSDSDVYNFIQNKITIPKR
jgi:hypothetical protein